jgi:hypothetical protein
MEMHMPIMMGQHMAMLQAEKNIRKLLYITLLASSKGKQLAIGN